LVIAPGGSLHAHRDQGRILTLPMFAEITREQQDEGD
jgi:hypothetical protein